MNQQALADAVGINRVAVAKIELGRRAVTVDEAVALADALGVSVAALIGAEQLLVSETLP